MHWFNLFSVCRRGGFPGHQEWPVSTGCIPRTWLQVDNQKGCDQDIGVLSGCELVAQEEGARQGWGRTNRGGDRGGGSHGGGEIKCSEYWSGLGFLLSWEPFQEKIKDGVKIWRWVIAWQVTTSKQNYGVAWSTQPEFGWSFCSVVNPMTCCLSGMQEFTEQKLLW